MTTEIKQFVAEKHLYFNEYKLTHSADSFVSDKKYRYLVYRKLKEAQIFRGFFKEYETSEEKRKFMKHKKRKKKRSTSLKLMKMVKKRKTKCRCVTFFKIGDIFVLTNYRPISLTPTFAKKFLKDFNPNQLIKICTIEQISIRFPI